MRITIIESFRRCLKLRYAFRIPDRNCDAGNRVGNQHIRESTNNILPAFGFVSENLQPACRNTTGKFERFLKRNDVSVFMSDHIAQPVVGTSQNVIEIFRPNFNLVVKKVCGTVGVILDIFDDKIYFGIRLILIQSGNVGMNVFSYFCDNICGALGSLMVVHPEVLCFNGFPNQFRMIRFIFLSLQRG